MERVSEIVARRVGVKIGPERFQDPLPVQAVSRLQGEQLDERGSLPLPPDVVRNWAVAQGDPKAAKQPDAQGCGAVHGLLPRVRALSA